MRDRHEATAVLSRPSTDRPRRVLIVDDLEANLQLLTGQLAEFGFDVVPTRDGNSALPLARDHKPDLILLDVVMPDKDGYQVCRELKADPVTTDIPVIFITARKKTEDILRGLQCGAVDYITRPFHSDELIARARIHIESKSSRDLLLAYNRQLQRMTAHLRRVSDDKSRLLGIVSHDIRGAFSNVVSVARLMAEEEVSGEEARELIEGLGMEAEYMISLSENLLNVDAIEKHSMQLQMEKVEVKSLVDFALQTHQVAAHAKQSSFSVRTDDSAIRGDLFACRQILSNLVSNAIKYSSNGSHIHISGQKHPDGLIHLLVRDQGIGISREDQLRLFLPFSRGSNAGVSHEHSVGLGLSIVKFMTEKMGGTVECESTPGLGSTFKVSLPVWQQPAETLSNS